MRRGYVRRIVWLMVLMLAFAVPAMAQEVPPANTASVDLEKEEQAAKEKAKKEADERIEQSKSVRDRMFSDVRNSAALSVGVLENFDSNLFYDSGNARSDFYTLVYPRFIFNTQREHGTLTAEYQGGYRIYTRFSELNTAEHTGTLRFSLGVSPRTTVNVYDSLSYLPFNSLSFLQQPSFTPGQSGLPPSWCLPRLRTP